jgi:hypothetical protein
MYPRRVTHFTKRASFFVPPGLNNGVEKQMDLNVEDHHALLDNLDAEDYGNSLMFSDCLECSRKDSFIVDLQNQIKKLADVNKRAFSKIEE